MHPFYRLEPVLQRYDWGSTTALQGVLGLPVDGRPVAEMWMGAHPRSPSTVRGWDEPRGAPGEALDALIREHPEEVLGRRAVETYGPRLPFLLKVLAAEKALSLQVHPHPHRARAGFNRENRAGLPLDAPERSFKDDQHKPEMVVAVTRFEGLSGFRRPRRVLELLDGLPGDLVGQMRDALLARPTKAGLRTAFALAVRARTDPEVATDLALTIEALRRRLEDGSPSPRADATVVLLAEQHPGDPGAVTALLLNRVTLEPGESMFVPAGHVHAYLSGCGMEIMASSDNVLRAGLTGKFVDVEALLDCATFTPGPAARPAISPLASALAVYRAPIQEFAMVFGRVSDDDAGGAVALPASGPRIVVVGEGSVRLESASGVADLVRGDCVLVPDVAGPVTVRGQGLAAVGYLP
ncbi:mannose-6-phosphate isomerase [Paraoerskovia sediminicola]|uniref:mannose-6-phosphate isomerase n=1 Tax=Paraoerskovia sediminicola TaxID=1138587 RepID=A0ABN6XDB2_9CELL|nr:mannose-6-phosphate isomerase, class I [Paraoerskovia sediminicola]BDZ42670.1 mannose-6-phosphate isomerase [Paraoerskovia sediminicola]